MSETWRGAAEVDRLSELGTQKPGGAAEVGRLSEPGSPFQCSLSFVPHSEELHSAPLEALVDGEMGGELSFAPCPMYNSP